MKRQDDEGQLTPLPAPAQMACYDGVPGEVVEQCEFIHGRIKLVWLEGMRRVRDLLAPYGQFKQWCIDHEENYGAVQYHLSQAYGDVTKRAIEETHSVAWLDEPETTTVQALETRNRALEAEVAIMRSRSAAQWAEIAAREEEERRHAEANAYIHKLVEAIAVDDRPRFEALAAGEITLAQAWARHLLSVAVKCISARDEYEARGEPVMFRLRLWMEFLAVPITGDEPRGLLERNNACSTQAEALAGQFDWLVTFAKEHGLTNDADVDRLVAGHIAAVEVLQGMWAAPPTDLTVPEEALVD